VLRCGVALRLVRPTATDRGTACGYLIAFVVLELYSNAAVSWPAFHWPDIAFLVAYSAGILLYYKKPVRP
jgi:hypothetical protein